MGSDKLSAYKKRRHFKQTTEPKPRVSHSKSKRAFVVQKHDASRLHYDLRLEMGGVLKSWAVPKGPSLNPEDKRLAVLTEDHPLSYKNFEGVIPEGEYGAGTVIVWDRGTYENIKMDKKGKAISMSEAFENGTVEVRLKGKKLKGAFALIHMQDKNWLLIKMKDDEARKKDITKAEPRSVKSGKNLEEVRRDKSK